jgi:hypothetical protein
MRRSKTFPASHPYQERLTVPFALPTGLYGAMLVIWHLRLPLQHRFPLHRGQVRDYVRFLAWCATSGRKEYDILRSIPDWNVELSRPIALPILKGDRWRDGFSVAMFLFGVAHCHYTFSAILEEARVRDLVATSFWRGERHARCAPPPAAWKRDFLRRKFGTLDGFIAGLRLGRHDAGKTKAQLLEKLHLTDLALEWAEQDAPRTEFASISGQPPTETAHLPHGLKRSPVRVPFPFLRTASVVEWLNSKPSEPQLSGVTSLVSVAKRRRPVVEHPFGVNLFGYARGELGIGEDVRMVAAALQSQRIPFCIVNVKPGKEISQEDYSVDHWISDQPYYGINLLCVTGVEQARLACEKGVAMFSGRYNIGLSPWELPQWPLSCQYAYGMVDEIWGISSYAAQAYREAPRPVHAMSLPVTVGPISELGRAEFDLPEKAYLFVFAFDIHSTVSRKNPEAVIRAFQKAFPNESSETVGLVIKVNTPAADMDSLTMLDRLALLGSKYRAWNAVKRLAEEDPRIHIIEGSMRRPQVMALYRACDCFVSLHRAEGFGRCLAEALLLNLQLIATGFSGNMDYCAEPRVGLVRYHLRPLRPDEYYWSHGQMWAEPNIEHAAELMRDIRKNPRDTRDFHFDFSPASVGRRYAKRLHEIRKEFCLRQEESAGESMGMVSAS